MGGEHDHDYASADDMRDAVLNIEELYEAIGVLAKKAGLEVAHAWKEGCCKEPTAFHVGNRMPAFNPP